MTPAERLKKWVEDLSESWKDKLKGWLVSFLVGGLTDALEDLNPDQRSALEANLQDVIDNPNTP